MTSYTQRALPHRGDKKRRCTVPAEELARTLIKIAKQLRSRTFGGLADTASSRRHVYADIGCCCLRIFSVRNNMLRLIPNMAVKSTHGLALLVEARKLFLLGHTEFHRFGRGQTTSDASFPGSGPALLPEFQLKLGNGGHDAGNRAPSRGAGVHPFPQGPHVDAAAGQLIENSGDFADGTAEPIHGDDHKVVAFAEVTYALRPTGSVVTGATGRGVGEDPVGGDASFCRASWRWPGDRLLPGGHPEVRGRGHTPVEPRRSDNSSGIRFTGTRTRP